MNFKAVAMLGMLALLPVESVLACGAHACAVTNSQVNGLGNASKKSLETAIELHFGYGRAYFYENPNTEAEKFINQGYASMNVFHYLDAYRSFRQAYLKDMNSSQALVGLIFSILSQARNKEALELCAKHLDRIDEIKKKSGLTAKEEAWYEFSKAYFSGYSGGAVTINDGNIMRLDQAYQKLEGVDGTNSEFLSFVNWQMYNAGYGSQAALNGSATVLKRFPEHAGSLHYTLHIAEAGDEIYKAEKFGKKLDQAAPKSAHAVHMYGHTLPQMGKWQESLNQFLKAHQIHLDYSKKYQIPLQEDWHYAHNLDLLAGAYLGLGDTANAIKNWTESMKYDSRAVKKNIGLLVATGDFAKAEMFISSEELDGGSSEARVQALRGELEFLRDGKEMTTTEQGAYGQIINYLVQGASKPQLIAQLEPQLEQYFTAKLTSGGFDGWSHAFVDLMRIRAIAKKLNIQTTVALLNDIEKKAQDGTLKD